MSPPRALVTLTLLLPALVAGCGGSAGSPPPTVRGLHRINHLVIIYQENHSLDNLYGEFAGAEGLAAAASAPPQVDARGVAYPVLPQPMDAAHGAVPDVRFPANLPNAPFNIDDSVPADQMIPDLVHRYYQEQRQIHGGRMDRFVEVSNAKGLAMGYYHTALLPMAPITAQYTLCDHFFHSAFGGSFLNHMFLIAAAAPVFPNAPPEIRAQLDASGYLVDDQAEAAVGLQAVTPDGHVVNTAFSVNAPHPGITPPAQLVPNQTMATIGDRMSDGGVTWGWYAGGWNDALAGHASPRFQYHHQPFVYFQNYADGTRAKATHLFDEQDFLAQAEMGALPSVSFVKPLGWFNEHPGYTDLRQGEQHLVDLVTALQQSPNWKDTAIIITYDENGGFWDHVPPPVRDPWGPGARVPTIVISPFARRGYVDKTVYDTSSILATIEHRFGLPPLNALDAAAIDLSPALVPDSPAM